MSGQYELFKQKNLNPIDGVKRAMRNAVKGCGKSRDQVVDLMNEMAEIEGVPSREGNSKGITVDMMEKWLAPSAKHMIPWKLIPVFCEVTKNIQAIEVLAGSVGGQVIAGEDITLLKWARYERELRKMKRDQKSLERILTE